VTAPRTTTGPAAPAPAGATPADGGTRPPASAPPPGPRLHLDRLVLGLLLAAGGTGWLLDDRGVAVPWHAAPAAAVVLVGLALLVSLVGGRGRGNLVSLGIVLLVPALAIGIGAQRFAGPVGEVVVAPGAEPWPAPTRLAAGTVTVDLTRAPLPPDGRLEVAVGAGRVDVRVPAGQVRVETTVVMGTVTVDGEVLRQGVDLRWSDPAGAPRTLVLDVGTGDVEVNRVAP
jgi:hypothetical protein